MKEPKLIIPEDCNNSPKKKFLTEFNIAFATQDMDRIASCLHEDLICDMIGHEVIKGRTKFMDMLEEHKASVVTELRINTMVTHGPVATCEGTMVFQNGKKYAFCDIYHFLSAGKNLIKEMKSFVMEVEK